MTTSQATKAELTSPDRFENTAAGQPAPEQLEANFLGFKLFRFADRFLALSHNLGAVDLNDLCPGTLAAYQVVEECAVADSLDKLKAQVAQFDGPILAVASPPHVTLGSAPRLAAAPAPTESGTAGAGLNDATESFASRSPRWPLDPTAHAQTYKLSHALLFGGEQQRWRLAAPDVKEINPVEGMICGDESRFMHWLARDYFTGQGHIVDLGPLAGGSTHSFASGLAVNPAAQGRTDIIYSYDLWHFFESWEKFFPGATLAPGQDLLPYFARNLRRYEHWIKPHKGDLCNYSWIRRPIEILFIDAAKTPKLWAHIRREFFSHLIPNHSLVIQQDWVCEECPWLHLTMTKFADYFEYVDSPDGGTVCFLLKKPLPPEFFREDVDFVPSLSEARSLFQTATGQLQGWYRLFIQLSEANYLAGHGHGDTAAAVVARVVSSADYHARFVPYVQCIRSKIAALTTTDVTTETGSSLT